MNTGTRMVDPVSGELAPEPASAATGAPPPDWPELWAEVLRVRAGPSGAAHAVDARARSIPAAGHSPARDLAWSAREGWYPEGAWSEGSVALFQLYRPLLDARTARTPWVVAQLGQSLDGCVATHSGDSYFVTGPESLLHLHRLRALADVVLVGAGTVVADDPRLTTRRAPGPNPVRVVLDPAARLDGRARLLRDGEAPSLWLCDARHAGSARARLAEGAAVGKAEVLAVEGLLDEAGGCVPAVALAALAARGLHRVFVEGGGVTVSRFLTAGCLDQLHLVVAPVLIGAGRPGLQLPAQAVMRDCPRPPARVLVLGDDVLWDLSLRSKR